MATIMKLEKGRSLTMFVPTPCTPALRSCVPAWPRQRSTLADTCPLSSRKPAAGDVVAAVQRVPVTQPPPELSKLRPTTEAKIIPLAKAALSECCCHLPAREERGTLTEREGRFSLSTQTAESPTPEGCGKPCPRNAMPAASTGKATQSETNRH